MQMIAVVMKKQQDKHEIDQFEDYCHLWNIVPGGSGKGIALLRKIVDKIQNDNYSDPGNKPPSFIITGATGRKLVARALVNSLAIEDIRTCPGKYFENGIFSFQFFWNSIANTAHIITNVEQLEEKAEPVLWKFLKNRRCSYYNGVKRAYDNIVYCNGLIIMTAHNKDMVSGSIIEATDYIIKLEPLTMDQLEAAVHQRLVFCGIEYEGEEVLKKIIDQGVGKIEFVIPFLKKCLMLMKAEMGECLDMKIIQKAIRLSSLPVPPSSHHNDDIPF